MASRNSNGGRGEASYEPKDLRVRTDVPTTNDLLKFKGKAKGLAYFVKECPTPMTLAIQGGWGSGKSTMIQLIVNELEKINRDTNKEIASVTIETWKFAHLAEEEDIPAAFAAEVYKQLFRLDSHSSDNEDKSALIDRAKKLLLAITPTLRKMRRKFFLTMKRIWDLQQLQLSAL